MKINIWIPSLFESKGGIQIYSAFLVKAIGWLFPDGNLHISLKHDRADDPVISIDSHNTYHTSGQLHPRLRTLGFAGQLIENSLRYRADLIITTHLNFIPVAFYLKKFTGIPYWTIAHGIEAWNLQKPRLIKALKDADRILAVSHYTRDRLLIEQNLDPAKIVVLPNTFNLDRFQIAAKPPQLLQKYRLSADRPTILTVARLARSEQYKGYDRILQALPQIRQIIPNVHYILVGKGDDRTRLKELISHLQIEDCVTLAGFIPDEELCDYYNLCDVFAMPSKGEGFGIVYLEALACGKPCLGGDRDGAIDALCHGELGALVNPDDVDAIAQTLIQILQGTYPNPLMYQPELLRAKVIDIYGFDRFRQTLGDLLADWQQQRITK